MEVSTNEEEQRGAAKQLRKLTDYSNTQYAHDTMVLKLAKSGADIKAELTPESTHLLHMAVGVAGEAGELLDAIKKHAVYTKPIDRENVIEELGDLEFYMAGLRQGLAISRCETLKHNIDKLAKRYKGHNYSNEQAQQRADKVGS